MRVARIPVTTNATGDFSTTVVLKGKLLQWRYVPDATSPLDTGADVTLTGATTGLLAINVTNLGTSALTKSPRAPAHDLTGAALVYASTDPVAVPYVLGGELYTFVVDEGGNTLRGTFYIWMGD